MRIKFYLLNVLFLAMIFSYPNRTIGQETKNQLREKQTKGHNDEAAGEKSAERSHGGDPKTLLRNKITAVKLMDALEKNQIDTLNKYMTSEVIEHVPVSPENSRGITAVNAASKEYMNAIGDLKITRMMTVAEGNKVMVYSILSGVNKRPMYNRPEGDENFALNSVNIFLFREDGKVTEHWGIYHIAGGSIFGEVSAAPNPLEQKAIPAETEIK